MPQLKNFEWEISPVTKWYGVGFREMFRYKDLLFRLVRKELISSYQQTLLGPLWVILQPLLTVVVYIVVFNGIFGLSTEGVPTFLYYLCGIILWNFFADLFQSVSFSFSQYAELFEKAYFPRLIAPLSLLVLHLARFFIQFIFFLLILVFYVYTGEVDFNFLRLFIFLPVLLIVAGIAFGAGIIFTLAATKYRDIQGLMTILIRLLMFITPVFYSLAIVPQNMTWLLELNPLSTPFELFRYSFFGLGKFNAASFIYSTCVAIFLLVTGIGLFNKLNERLIDIV